MLTEGARPFAFAQQLWDRARWVAGPGPEHNGGARGAGRPRKVRRGAPGRKPAPGCSTTAPRASRPPSTFQRATCPPLRRSSNRHHRPRAPAQVAQPSRSGRGRPQRRGRTGASPFQSERVNHLPPTGRRQLRQQGRGVGDAGSLATSGGSAP